MGSQIVNDRRYNSDMISGGMRVSLMNSKHIFIKYGMLALIFITILALVGLYKIDILAEILANKDTLIFIELVFVMSIITFLMYALMILIESFNKE
ncbi:MAG: hypothetical protein WB392_04170 [Methanotrichaceae archaeon]